ncbi:transcriptional regulator, XRE family [Paenibacillus curdlanolyticus YK9]|uniref:Transcriptional regulator, XRE family n=1 Tax=Paenibacillus curdlanolyticus YK9 TaxID=717606 RepID=E0IBJ3_9BACL|nr:helix-turn-helix transcriptional regulator [Paenibacillus curdlanolyticus]EFM10073.1 transcriptional regulator, XRE family [Paenibacillus curdlanolyticus YK9]
MTFGERLKELREQRNMTQQDVAIAVNKSRTDIAGYETKGTSPNIETVRRLADLFKVSIDYMFGRTNDPYQLFTREEDMSPEQKNVIYRIAELIKNDLTKTDLISAIDFFEFLNQRNLQRKK